MYQVLHRDAENLGDRVARALVKLARSIFDFVSGYKHVKGPLDPNASLDDLRKAGFLFDDKQWLNVSVEQLLLQENLFLNVRLSVSSSWKV